MVSLVAAGGGILRRDSRGGRDKPEESAASRLFEKIEGRLGLQAIMTFRRIGFTWVPRPSKARLIYPASARALAREFPGTISG